MATKRPRGEGTTSDDGAKYQRREDPTREPETIFGEQTAAADPPTAHSVTDMAMEHGTRGVATGDTVATEAGQAVAAEPPTVLGAPASTEPDHLLIPAEHEGQRAKKKKKRKHKTRGGTSGAHRKPLPKN